jgi:glycosyltransferase involved in cell wall biosynthesis
MRVVQLVDTLAFGGAEQIVATLSSGLRTLGHEVFVVCLRDFGEQSVDHRRLVTMGVRLLALEKPPGADLRTLRNLVAFLRSERVDLINTHNHLVHHYGLAAGRLSGTRIVNTLHGIDTLNLPAWSSAVYYGCCLASDRIVSVCGPVQDELTRRYSLLDGKLEVIQNGIPLDRFLAVPLREQREQVVFGTVGRMAPVKDHLSLLRAFAIVHGQNPTCRLRLLGTGPLEGDLMNAAAGLGICDVVDFCGFDGDPAAFLQTVDVFVLPSKSEGMPLTLLEAMASGRPVIATAVGGVPGIIQPEFGWLCPPEDPHTLAARLQESLIADRENMGLAARARAKAQYGKETMVRRYDALYRLLCSRN